MFLDVNAPSVGGGIHSAAHRSCCPDGQVLMLRNTRAHETQHQHKIHHATTHLQLFNDFKQLRVLKGTKSQLRSGSNTGEEKEKGRSGRRSKARESRKRSSTSVTWKYIRNIELRQSQWWIHLLVAAGSDGRLAVSGRRVQHVQYLVFCNCFSPAATGSFNRDRAICSCGAAKGCQLVGKCSNKMETRDSPRLMPMCEFVHTVKKKGSTKLKKNWQYCFFLNYISAQLTCGIS